MQTDSRSQVAERRSRYCSPVTIVQLAGALVDLSDGKVRRLGRDALLSPLDLRLLRLLVDRTGADLARDFLRDEVSASGASDRAVDAAVRNLRKMIERDPSRPEHIHTVHGTGYRFDRPRSHPQPDSLPRQWDSFVGRGEQLFELGSLFIAGARLVTLQGPPGVGKTRCALQFAASAVVHGISGEPLFVSLADARDEAEVVAALATALALPLNASGSLADRLCRALVARDSGLIVLDNTEQLVEVLPSLLSRWMVEAPQLCWLATSQRALELEGEHLAVLSPMDEAEARLLFELRARAHGQPLDSMNPELLDTVCGRLEGLPLALELAAARVPTLGLAALDRALEDNFALLSRRAWDGVPRHATLHAAIAWSCSLLSASNRRTLGSLSVFRGGFTQAAAEDVVDCVAVAADLEELVGASLLVHEGRDARDVDRVRYRLTSSVWDFAVKELREDAGAGVRERHADWCLDLARRLGGEMWATAPRLHVDLLMDELPNLMEGHRFLLESNPLLALHLVVAMEPVIRVRASIQQHSALLSSSLDAAPDDAPPYLVARALAALAGGYSDLEDREAAGRRFEKARALSEESGDLSTMAWVLVRDGLRCIRIGEGERGEQALLRARSMSREAGEKGLEAEACAVLGILRENQGRLDDAEEVLRDALSLGRASRHDRAVAAALGNLSIVAGRRGLAEEASSLRGEAAQLYREIDSKLHLAAMLINQGVAAVQEGKCEEAVTRCEEAIAQCRLLGDSDGEAIATSNLAFAQWERGEHGKGEQGFIRAIEQFTHLGRPREQGFAHLGLALVRQVSGDLPAACDQLNESLDLFDRHGDALAARLAQGLQAVVLFEQGEREPALSSLDRALEAPGPTAASMTRALEGARRVLLGADVVDLGDSHYERVFAAALSSLLTRT